MSGTSVHLSPNLLVRLAMAKHSDGELRAAEEHARGCRRCRAELDDAARAGEHFRVHVFPRTHAAVARRGARRTTWRRLFPPLGLAAAVGAAGVATLLLVALPDRTPILQAKGGGALSVFVLRDEKVFAVADGARLRPGDRIRFAVQGAGFVLVASIDGRGQVSVYQPSTGLGTGAVTTLPDSIRLDDALGPERIFAVFSERPVPDAEVTRALAALGAAGPEAVRRERRLPLPYAQASLLIEKNDGP